jgi:hypothetical protein
MDSITDWTSSHTLSLDTTNEIEGTGANKVVMAAAALRASFFRLNYATTVDLSSTMGSILMPIFIPTPTAGAVQSIRLLIGKNATLAADYVYWDITTQYDGSVLATNAWNYINLDLATAVTGTNGTPDRTLTKSIEIAITGTAATMQLNGALLDYISVYKASVVGETLDFEGTFPDLNLGTCALTVEDEFTARSIVITGNYYKRWL